MKCIENISLEIKVFKSLFIQIIDGLNFGHIYDDYVAIWKCLWKSRRIFLKASISPGFRGQQSGDQSSSTEYKGRLLKTDTLTGRERVIRIWQKLMMGNVLIQPKYSDRPPPQTMNDSQSFGRINDICVCLCVCVCVWGGGGTLKKLAVDDICKSVAF